MSMKMSLLLQPQLVEEEEEEGVELWTHSEECEWRDEDDQDPTMDHQQHQHSLASQDHNQHQHQHQPSSGSQTRPGDALDPGDPGDMFECPGCGGFLGDPVTLPCGHSCCGRCVRLRRSSRCRVCGGRSPPPPPGGAGPGPGAGGGAGPGGGGGGELKLKLKVNVVLGGLLDKLFPEELRAFRTLCEVQELLTARRCFQEAVELATQLIQSGPEAVSVSVSVSARLCRAEAYAALRQYRLAMEDVEFCLRVRRSAEGLFRKAMVLRAMGQTDESLQVFLGCLALDEDFTGARRQVETILQDLLSPAGATVKEGLQATASPHRRGKTLADGFKGDGLKQVWSAPQLGDQDLGRDRDLDRDRDREGGLLLKRKLSGSGVRPEEPLVHRVDSWKRKRQDGGESRSPRDPRSHRARRALPRGQLSPGDLECALCIRLFYEPVTTPCGHTFCRRCLERGLDHAPQCPLCKDSLKEYLASRRYAVTRILDDLIRERLAEEHAERSRVHLEETRELSDLTCSVPIFVCTMAYPTVPCPLHVFEPRYRLMMRRCVDTGTRRFGMCINEPAKGFADYGCMLTIRSEHFLPDGRSVVDTVGGQRFRVLSRGVRDGYSTAHIEHLEDTRVEEGEEQARLQRLHDAVYDQAVRWFQNLSLRFHNQILQHFGPMPAREPDIQATPDGPACCWWLLAVLPIDPRHQLSVLAMTSLRQRLLKIQNILTYLQSSPHH